MLTKEELAERLDYTVGEIEEHIANGMPEGDEYAAAGWLLLQGHLASRRIVDTRFVAGYFGLTVPGVRAWSDCPNVGPGKYDLDEVVAYRLAKLKAQQGGAREELAAARARRVEVEVDQLEGKLISAADVSLINRKYVPEAQASLRDFYDSIGAMIDKDLNREGLIQEFRKAIERAVDALAEMSREYSEKLERFQSHLDSRGIPLVAFVDGLLDELEAANK